MNCHWIKTKSISYQWSLKRHETEMNNSSVKQNKSQLSPSINGARRIKTDLKTSENVFLQSCSRSRSSSPILPQKVAKSCETSKATGNSAIRCNEIKFFFLSCSISPLKNKKSKHFHRSLPKYNRESSWHCKINLDTLGFGRNTFVLRNLLTLSACVR